MRTLGLADPAFVAATALAPSGYDTDAAAYITAVETADGQALETAVADAINAFVVGCKADGIWDAIKASCILAGARTLNGALVPLVGTAPTSYNFVAGDYDRKTGLVGDGSTKYLNSNRNNNADPQNSKHMSVYASILHTDNNVSPMCYFGVYESVSAIVRAVTVYSNGSLPAGTLRTRLNSSSLTGTTGAHVAGFMGVSRNTSTQYTVRGGGSSTVETQSSNLPTANPIFAYALNDVTLSSVSNYGNGRLAFYSIGEALDLALLDARVTTLINAFAAAIP